MSQKLVRLHYDQQIIDYTLSPKRAAFLVSRQVTAGNLNKHESSANAEKFRVLGLSCIRIVMMRWRNTYKALLTAEHRQDSLAMMWSMMRRSARIASLWLLQATLPNNCAQKTRDLMKKEVREVDPRCIDLEKVTVFLLLRLIPA